MLSKPDFIAGMTLLTKNYIGWEFNLNDDIQIGLWYSAFKNLTSEQFKALIKAYIAKNEYPPKCIKNLTDLYVERQVKFAKIPPEKALQTVRDIVNYCGGWEYGKTDIYLKLKRYPTLEKTVREFEATLRTMHANDQYTADRFRKAYEENLKTSAENKVNQFLGIKAEPTQALGTAALPYET